VLLEKFGCRTCVPYLRDAFAQNEGIPLTSWKFDQISYTIFRLCWCSKLPLTFSLLLFVWQLRHQQTCYSSCWCRKVPFSTFSPVFYVTSTFRNTNNGGKQVAKSEKIGCEVGSSTNFVGTQNSAVVLSTKHRRRRRMYESKIINNIHLCE
jgi:hypothetical protein